MQTDALKAVSNFRDAMLATRAQAPARPTRRGRRGGADTPASTRKRGSKAEDKVGIGAHVGTLGADGCHLGSRLRPR